MRTLVVSDLHLGLRGGGALLARTAVRERLLEALQGVSRLVLLGDVLELRQGPVHEALAAARPVLAELGAALGPEREVVLTFGNHDHHLLDGWLARRMSDGAARPLGLEREVHWQANEPLGVLAEALAPARVSARYPGLWLSPRVYAMHGHYLDAETTLPTFERVGAGAMARLLARPLGQAAAAEDYEALLAPLYAWLHATAQRGGPVGGMDSNRLTLQAWARLRGDGSGMAGSRPWERVVGGDGGRVVGGDGGRVVGGSGGRVVGGDGGRVVGGDGGRVVGGDGERVVGGDGGRVVGGGGDVMTGLGADGRRSGWRDRALRGAFPLAVGALNLAGLGPLRAELNARTLRDSSLRAMGRVLERLGVNAEHVIFGHTHRAGPLAADDPGPWQAPKGTRLLNCGSWVHEPAFLGPDPASSAYRPGFAALLEDDAQPRLLNLLD